MSAPNPTTPAPAVPQIPALPSTVSPASRSAPPPLVTERSKTNFWPSWFKKVCGFISALGIVAVLAMLILLFVREMWNFTLAGENFLPVNGVLSTTSTESAVSHSEGGEENVTAGGVQPSKDLQVSLKKENVSKSIYVPKVSIDSRYRKQPTTSSPRVYIGVDGEKLVPEP